MDELKKNGFTRSLTGFVQDSKVDQLTVNLRWNHGVLEQLVIVETYKAGTLFERVPEWRPVPHVNVPQRPGG